MSKTTKSRRSNAEDGICKLPLVRGCVVFGYSVSYLRSEARRGNLDLVRIDGQDFVSEPAVRAMETAFKLRRAS